MATTSKVPVAPAGKKPPHPDGFVACRFQLTDSSRGTPRVSRTGAPGGGLHAAEFQTTCPLLVTTTCTAPGP